MEKQIEEMANIMCHGCARKCDDTSGCIVEDYAEAIFNAGYRKQEVVSANSATAPAADVVEVVRCKDCEHGLYMDSCSMYLCRCTGGKLRYADNYCNYGERKETNEKHS